MRLKGQVTVFLSMIILCVASLVCVLTESARMAGAQCYLQTAVYSALDSVFSQYHRGLWDDYRVLFAEYENGQELAEDFDMFLSAYLETDSWYPMRTEQTAVTEMLTAVDGGGEYLKDEILAYMKYGVWKLDFDDAGAELFCRQAAEAGAFSAVADSYRQDSKAAWKLEESLEAISKNLKRQQGRYAAGKEALASYDGGGFFDAAGELQGLLREMPGLIETYSRRAESLAVQLQESRREFEQRKGELSDEIISQMEQEIRQYESYVEADGERRREIEALVPHSSKNLLITEEAVLRAEEVQEIIDNWESEGEEGDDGPDVDSLWGSVAGVFSGIQIHALSFAHGVKDKEKEGWLKQVESMGKGYLLDFVLPEGMELSKGVADMSEFPSNTAVLSGGAAGTNLAEHLLVNEYCGEFFTHALSEEKKPFQYELEYLFGGEDTDEANLYQTVKNLTAAREGLNLVYLFSDAAKREEARNLAIAVTGGLGIAPLVLVTTFFILSVWALGEAVLDVRELLSGGKVPILKSADTWTLTLEGLLKLGREGMAESGTGENGLSYASYLKALLLLQEPSRQYFRMMDMMQLNLRRKQNSFRMRRSVYQVEISEKVCGKHVFFSLGFVEKLLNSGSYGYPMSAKAKRNYS